MTGDMKRFLYLSAALGLTACAQTPPVESVLPSADDYRYPSLQEGQVTAAALPASPWYDSAVSGDLQSLLTLAERESPAISIQEKRVEQARATLQAAEASRWVDVVLSGNASADLDLDTDESSDSARLGLGLDLPLDVNGRLRTLRNAARYNLYSAEALYDLTRNNTLLSLSLNVVDAAEASLLESLVLDQIETSRTLLQLTELRFAQGQASIVDVLQQRDQIASLEQQLPPLQTTRRQAIDTISTTTGLPPATDDNPAMLAALPEIAPVTAYPAANRIIETRPELRASVFDLQAADATYTAAILNRLPSFSLSSSAATSLLSGDASSFISATLSGAFTVFDSGAKDAAIDRTRAQYEESGIILLQDWLAALAEINGLIRQENEGLENIRLARQRLDTQEQLLESARRRYRQGASDYLPVLTALTAIQNQERRLVSLEAQQARIRIRLHAALGLPPATDNERTI